MNSFYVDLELRKRCLKGLKERNLPGYAIGGLSGGESKVFLFFLLSFNNNYSLHSLFTYSGVG